MLALRRTSRLIASHGFLTPTASAISRNLVVPRALATHVASSQQHQARATPVFASAHASSERFYYTVSHGVMVQRDGAPQKDQAASEDRKKDPEEKLSKVELQLQLQREKDDYVEAELPPPVKKPLWDRIKGALHHYWVGTKLLATDTRVSLRLLGQIMRGKELSRREKKQLRTTIGDMFRMVPFIVILVVPFAEFALPFLLHFFPNMLPSTFEDKFEKQEKTKKLLQARLETARFLQETLEEMALETKRPDSSKNTQAFNEFFKKIRTSGQQASDKDIILFSKLFKDDLTLDNLSRAQIIGMCKYMNVNAFGTTSFLRSQLRKRFTELKEDDKLIEKEGVHTLEYAELQAACQARGMRTLGLSTKRMRSELQQWIDLRLKAGIPATLLVLARAMMLNNVTQAMSEDLSVGLQAALSSLPDEVVKEVEVVVSEAEGKSALEKKLEMIKEQEELIKEEKAEEAKAILADVAPSTDKAEILKDTAAPTEELNKEQIAALSDAVNMVASPSIVAEEREELEQIKEDLKDFAKGVEDLKNAPDLTLSKGSTHLAKGVENMIKKIESEISQVEKEGNSTKLITPDLSGEITLNDLETAMGVLKNKAENPEALKKLIDQIDTDKDGKITLEELEKYADSLESLEGVGTVAEPKKTD